MPLSPSRPLNEMAVSGNPAVIPRAGRLQRVFGAGTTAGTMGVTLTNATSSGSIASVSASQSGSLFVASQEFGGVGTAPIPVNEGDMLGFSGLAGAAYGAVIRW